MLCKTVDHTLLYTITFKQFLPSKYVEFKSVPSTTKM